MTFRELQNKIIQTGKARKGVKNREDYFEHDENEDFWRAVYKKALSAANSVVKRCEVTGEVNSSDSPKRMPSYTRHGKIIDKEHINMRARPKLAKAMEKATCYLLDGELSKSKRNDVGALTIWAEYLSHSELIVDEAAYAGEGEYFKAIRVSEAGLFALEEVLLPKQPKRKESTGRPVKYGLKAKIQARKLKEQGTSIRKIAEIMEASTFTVQRLLK